MSKITKFENYIEKNYPGLNFISLPNEEYLPGQILNNDDRIVDGLSRIFNEEPDTKWITKKINANIVGGTIQGNRDLDIGVNVLGIFSLRAGSKAQYSISFSFDQVSQVVFDTTKGAVYENEVRRMILNLKKTNKKDWRDILHNYVVISSVYVESMTVEFYRNGNAILEAQIPEFSNEVKIDTKYEWNNNGKIEIKNNKLPFGVTGFTIKRMM